MSIPPKSDGEEEATDPYQANDVWQFVIDFTEMALEKTKDRMKNVERLRESRIKVQNKMVRAHHKLQAFRLFVIEDGELVTKLNEFLDELEDHYSLFPIKIPDEIPRSRNFRIKKLLSGGSGMFKDYLKDIKDLMTEAEQEAIRLAEQQDNS